MAYSFSQKELDEIHQIQVQMLAEVDRICRKNDIRYFVSGGTMLGAVRNHKFIPWDDDIDVRMLRSEYERFFETCKKDLDWDKFFLQDRRTDPGYPWYYGKLRYRHSHYVREGQEHLKMQDGIFIDLFYSDGLPTCTISRRYVVTKCWILKKFLYSTVGSVTEENLLKRFLYKLMNKFPKDKIFEKLDKISKRYQDTQYEFVGNYGLLGLTQVSFTKREWYTTLIEVEFENMKVFIPERYHDWLVMAYGEDYMTPPPEEERGVHNLIVKYSIEE